MTITDFIDLRDRCLNLVEEAVKATGDAEYLARFQEIAELIYLMDPTEAVENTLKGIIGYYLWIADNSRTGASFRRDAMHDLLECVRYSEEDWYSPRTSQYKKFYKKS